MSRQKLTILIFLSCFVILFGVAALSAWITLKQVHRDLALLRAFRREDTWKHTFMNMDKHTEEIMARLDEGANPNLRESGQQPILILAIEMGNDVISHQLLEHGADVNTRRLLATGDLLSETGMSDTDPTALSLAILLDKNHTIDDLLAHNADPNARYGDVSTPLMAACVAKNSRVVKALLAKRADVNTTTAAGSTALMLAAQQGDAKIVAALLGAHADVNARNRTGKSVLQFAQDNPDIVDLLKQHGARE